MTDDPKIFMTVSGDVIPLKPISLLDQQLIQDAVEAEFRERGEPIDPPAYRIEQLGYDEDNAPTEAYTFTSIIDAPEEDKEKWATHVEALMRMGEERQRRSAILFAEGADIQLPDSDDWIKRRKKLFNEDVPDDPDERKVYYLNKILLKTPADKDGFMWSVYSLSMTGATEERIQAMERLFWSQMAIGKRSYSGDDITEDAQGKEPEDMVLFAGDEGRNGSGVAGDDLETIQTVTNGRPGRDHSVNESEEQNVTMGELSRQNRDGE